jgi:hypothetical protein
MEDDEAKGKSGQGREAKGGRKSTRGRGGVSRGGRGGKERNDGVKKKKKQSLSDTNTDDMDEGMFLISCELLLQIVFADYFANHFFETLR